MPSLDFLITSLIVALIPATGVIYTVSTGLAQGRRASIFADLGCTAVIKSPQIQAWLRRGFAASFAGLGANLALTEK